MSATTLAEAQTKLSEAKTAYSEALKARSLGVSDRQVSRQNLNELQAAIGYWEKRVNELTAAQTCSAKSGFITPKWST